jgi:hypothetical protein
MIDRRRWLAPGYVLIGVVGGTAVALTPIFFLLPIAPHSKLPLAAIIAETVAIVLAMAWAVFFAARAYLTFDEFQREKDKSAWYWGGITGLAASAPPFVFIGWGGLHRLDPGIPGSIHLARAFMLGYCLPLVFMICGYLISRFWPRSFRRAQ